MSSLTQTVLFTDLANYTEAVQDSSRQEIRNLIKKHRELVANTLQSFGGELIKEIGDSFLFLFGSATDAVKAAIKLMESLDEGPRFQIRISLCTGDVVRIDNDVFGDTVNLASRILTHTPVGQIYFSQSTMLSMNQSEIPWMELGLVSYKGFYGKYYVYEAITNRNIELPSVLREAIKQGTLRVGSTHDTALLSKHVVLLFGSAEEISSQIGSLPLIPPANIWRIGQILTPKERWEWTNAGHHWLIGDPSVLFEKIRLVEAEYQSSNTSDTIILKSLDQSIAELRHIGLALPKVPLSNIVSSYTYDLITTGEFVLSNPLAVLRVVIRDVGCEIQALGAEVQLNQRIIAVGSILTLNHGDEIRWRDIIYQFLSIEDDTYCGLISGYCTSKVPIGINSSVEIGREPQGEGMVISDRRGQSNIKWCMGARAVEAQMNGFSIDRAMSGRRQAKVEFSHGQLVLQALHKQCPTYVLDNQQLSLVSEQKDVVNGSIVITGTSVISVNGVEI